MAYATKKQIYEMVKFLRPDFNEEDINDRIHSMAQADVKADFKRLRIPSTVADSDELLLNAEICYYIEIATMLREVEGGLGVVAQETMGSYTKKYASQMPMFFFAQGSNEPFLNLLPNETFRMRGFKYLRAFKYDYWNITDENGGGRPTPSVSNDTEFHLW
jgi:hypothetical protein